LRKENAFYQAHLRSAETVTTALGTKNWPILDEFAASADDAEAAAIISMLREAARHDEQETALADPLRRANDAAVALVVQRAKNPGPADTPTLRPPVPPPAGGGPRPLVTLPGTDQEQPPAGTEPASPLPPPARLKARDVAAYVLKIADAAEAENPDTEFEISWRVVTD
jgi:hypothetical protein